jgi:hypothetical protein
VTATEERLNSSRSNLLNNSYPRPPWTTKNINEGLKPSSNILSADVTFVAHHATQHIHRNIAISLSQSKLRENLGGRRINVGHLLNLLTSFLHACLIQTASYQTNAASHHPRQILGLAKTHSP